MIYFKEEECLHNEKLNINLLLVVATSSLDLALFLSP